MSSTNTKPRAESSALAPGITLFEKPDGRGNAPRVVRASAQVEGRQRLRTRGIERHGLEEALRQVCAWRFEHAPGRYDSAEDLLAEALEAAGTKKFCGALPELPE